MIRLPLLGWSFLFILLFPSWTSRWVPLNAFEPRRALSNWILIEEIADIIVVNVDIFGPVINILITY